MTINSTHIIIQQLGHPDIGTRNSSGSFSTIVGIIISLAIAVGFFYRQKKQQEYSAVAHPVLELPRFESFGNIEDMQTIPSAAEDGATDDLGRDTPNSDFDDPADADTPTAHSLLNSSAGSHSHRQLELELANMADAKQMGIMDGFVNKLDGLMNTTPTNSAGSSMALMDESNPDDDGV